MESTSKKKQIQLSWHLYRQTIIRLIVRLFILQIIIVLGLSGFALIKIIINSAELSTFYIAPKSMFWYWWIMIIEMILIVLITLNWALTTYAISDSKIVIRSGVFIQSIDIFAMSNIESVKVQKSFLGTMFRYGTIALFSPTYEKTIYIKHVSQANEVSDLIMEYVMLSKNESKVSVRAK